MKKQDEKLIRLVTFRLTNKEYEELLKLAKQEKRSVSNFIHSKLF